MSRWAERWAALSTHSDTVDNVDTVGRPPAGSPPEVHSVTQCQSVMAPDADTETRRNTGVLGSALHSVHSVNSVTYNGEKTAVGVSTVSTTLLTLCDTVKTQPLAAPPDTSSFFMGDTVDSVDSVEAEDEERAAIIEYDGGVPREWAEGYAGLDPDQVPSDVPPRRWALFIDDVGRFLDGPFCQTAAHLGWGPYDLFGADAVRPFARIDQMGLLWLIKGNELIALAADTAVIDVSGQRLTYRRRAHQPGCVLAWELAR